MGQTRHRDVKSLHAYQRKSGREREVVSNVIQGSKSSLLGGCARKMLKPRVKKERLLSIFVQLS